MKVTIAILAALVWAAPADAYLQRDSSKCDTLKCRAAAQKLNLAHAKYVAKNGGGAHQRWARHAVKWLTKEYNETMAAIERLSRPKIDSCLQAIINRENRAMDPTLDYGGGHGNVYEPYGIPQANPGTKMASAGPDWRTNPWTQIKWMIGYVNSRYGGSCAALAHHNRYGSY